MHSVLNQCYLHPNSSHWLLVVHPGVPPVTTLWCPSKLGGLKQLNSNDKIAIFARLVSFLLWALLSPVKSATVAAPPISVCAVTCGYTTVHKELGSSSSTSTDHHNNNLDDQPITPCHGPIVVVADDEVAQRRPGSPHLKRTWWTEESIGTTTRDVNFVFFQKSIIV